MDIAAVKITAAELKLIALAKVGAVTGAALGKSLLAHPTKAALQKAVSKEIAVLGAVIPAKELALSTAVTNGLAGINAVYSDVEIEDPSTASDITTGEAGVATAASNFTATAASIQAAITQLTDDLANG